MREYFGRLCRSVMALVTQGQSIREFQSLFTNGRNFMELLFPKDGHPAKDKIMACFTLHIKEFRRLLGMDDAVPPPVFRQEVSYAELKRKLAAFNPGICKLGADVSKILRLAVLHWTEMEPAQKEAKRAELLDVHALWQALQESKAASVPGQERWWAAWTFDAWWQAMAKEGQALVAAAANVPPPPPLVVVEEQSPMAKLNDKLKTACVAELLPVPKTLLRPSRPESVEDYCDRAMLVRRLKDIPADRMAMIRCLCAGAVIDASNLNDLGVESVVFKYGLSTAKKPGNSTSIRSARRLISLICAHGFIRFRRLVGHVVPLSRSASIVQLVDDNYTALLKFLHENPAEAAWWRGDDDPSPKCTLVDASGGVHDYFDLDWLLMLTAADNDDGGEMPPRKRGASPDASAKTVSHKKPRSALDDDDDDDDDDDYK